MNYIFFVFFLVLIGCSPGSLHDYYREGEASSRGLLKELQQIQNREQLIKAEPVLKKRFEKIVLLMIDAREFQLKHPEESLDISLEDERLLTEQLQEELKRLYAMEGGKEIVERAQREAMLKLDSFEKTFKQKRSRLK